VRLLEQVGADVRQGLLAVPGAAVRGAQAGDEIDELLEVGLFGLFRHLIFQTSGVRRGEREE
jgi:hypothetical protein